MKKWVLIVGLIANSFLIGSYLIIIFNLFFNQNLNVGVIGHADGATAYFYSISFSDKVYNILLMSILIYIEWRLMNGLQKLMSNNH
ncbi:MAG: hypothetical protein CMO01_06840 [Thalassobius sp.]|nr:hypothetical protein [Thalassovita sp.]